MNRVNQKRAKMCRIWCLMVIFFAISSIQCGSIDASPPPPLVRVQNCGSTKEMVRECFQGLSEHLIDFLLNFKINITKEEILKKCK